MGIYGQQNDPPPVIRHRGRPKGSKNKHRKAHRKVVTDGQFRLAEEQLSAVHHAVCQGANCPAISQCIGSACTALNQSAPAP